jgi:hypothetical protein
MEVISMYSSRRAEKNQGRTYQNNQDSDRDSNQAFPNYKSTR